MQGSAYARVEGVVRKRNGSAQEIVSRSGVTSLRSLDDVHEILAQQAELEKQNEELRTSQQTLEAERARFRDLYDFAPVGYLTIASDGTIGEANHAAATMLGRARDAVIGRRLGAYVAPADRARLQEVLDAHFGQEASGACELHVGDDPAAARVVVMAAALAADRARSRVTLTDVTWRRHAEQEMLLMERSLAESQRMEAVGRLAGGIAHDFNNLLTVINAYSDMLGDDLPPDDPRHDAAYQIAQAGARAADLTAQLLAFSRKQVLAVKVVDVNEIVRSVARMLSRVVGERIALTTDLVPGEARAELDPGQFEQVLVNLAVNARDAMPGGGRLRFATSIETLHEAMLDASGTVPPGCYVRVEVQDTGQGIAPDVVPRIFEPFFTTKALGRGTGLGLSMVYGVVAQSHGHISVDSTLGVGSCFRILLPCAVVPEVVAARADIIGAAAVGETVLLVDDASSPAFALTQHTLTALGYTVVVAAGADVAMRALGERGDQIDLLLINRSRAASVGEALAERARILWPELRVLSIGGDDPAGGLVAGFTADALARAVRARLDAA